LFCPTSYYKEEVQGKDRLRQQSHGSPHIHWDYDPLQEEKGGSYAVFLLQE
jgi:hypothetical protein